MLRKPAIVAQGTLGKRSCVSPGRARTASPMTARFRSTASYAIDVSSSERRYGL